MSVIDVQPCPPDTGGGGDVAVEDEGNPVLAAATTINFVGAGVVATDAGGGQVNVTITGAAAGGTVATADEGTPVLAGSTELDFVGAGVTATDGGGGTTTVTVPGYTDEQVRDAVGAALVAGLGVTITVDDPGDTITIATTVTQYTDEMAQDAVGAMVTGNTETGISVTYDDAANKLNFVAEVTQAELDVVAADVAALDTRLDGDETVIANILSTGVFDGEVAGGDLQGTYPSPTLVPESVQDIVGGMVTGNVETGIDVTYDDPNGKLDFALSAEFLQDLVGAMFSGNVETGIAATYDDPNGKIDLAVSITQYTDEMARDAVGAALVAGNNIDITVSDPADTITIDVEGLTSADISDFAEAARDTIGTALVAGSNVTITVNDPADTITIAASGGGGSSSAAWDPVRMATVVVLAATYNAGAKTLTATANGAFSADGVNGVLNDRVLVKNQTDAGDNGVYTVTDVGSAGTPWVLTRAIDADASAEFVSNKTVRVQEGSRNADTAWFLDVIGAVTLDTTDLVFTATPLASMWKRPVRVATAATLPNSAVYALGLWLALSNGTLVIDGVTLSAGDRVLVKNHSAAGYTGHGIFRVVSAGSAGSTWNMQRDNDVAESADYANGLAVRVVEGTANADTEWFLDGTGAVTLDTTALMFTQSNGPEVMAATDLFLFASYA